MGSNPSGLAQAGTPTYLLRRVEAALIFIAIANTTKGLGKDGDCNGEDD
jgi:hypothetical protein